MCVCVCVCVCVRLTTAREGKSNTCTERRKKKQWVFHSTLLCVCALSCVRLFATPWTVACQLLCPWDSPSKNTGVGCYALLQGIFPTQGSNPHLLHWQVDSLLLAYHLEAPYFPNNPLILGDEGACLKAGPDLDVLSATYPLTPCSSARAVSHVKCVSIMAEHL